MFSRYLEIAIGALFLATSGASAAELRVCADPANLPLSNDKREGFENKVVELLAGELGRPITYVWWMDRRKSPLEALDKHLCDLVPGALANAPGVATTRPYLRSGYAFVTRAGSVTSFDDPELRHMTIGVQSVGDDAVTPAATALLHHGLTANIRAYTLHGHYSDPNSSGEIINAVASGKIDAAVVWGPFAGYFAHRQNVPLNVVLAERSGGDPPLVYDIAMATRRDDTELQQGLNRALVERRADIDAILAAYEVPTAQPDAP
jgi:mxaJ protein